MAYLPHLHYCYRCGKDLGTDNGDGVCIDCEFETCECGRTLSTRNKSGVCWYCNGRAPDRLMMSAGVMSTPYGE